jgi:hypothetical protein
LDALDSTKKHDQLNYLELPQILRKSADPHQSDINFTCGFDEEDFSEIPSDSGDSVPLIHLDHPDRELRMHSNYLKDVTRKQ